MKCSRCNSSEARQLVHEVYEGVSIDRCPACRGVWLDEGELKLILDDRETVFSEAFKAQVLAASTPMISEAEIKSRELCPHCGQAMMHMNWGITSGVIVDRCVGHGIWFDSEELERIQAFHEHWSDRTLDPGFRKEIAVQLKTEEMRFENEQRMLDQRLFAFIGRRRRFSGSIFEKLLGFFFN
jgi:Zn-finger nucleic acid-binding protein